MPLEQSLHEVEVLALELVPPVIQDVSTPVHQVMDRMREQNAGCALITRDGKLAGIFTERDVMRRILPDETSLTQPISKWMTPDPVSVAEDAPVSDVILKMCGGGFRRMVVRGADGEIAGCVRHKDVIAYLAGYHADRILNLPPDPDQVATSRHGA